MSSTSSSATQISAPIADQSTKTGSTAHSGYSDSLSSLSSIIRPYSHSAIPAGALSSLFFASCITNQAVWDRIKSGARAPPLYQRFGFGAALGLASYALSLGDVYNGSGIATAWSTGYLFFNFHSALRAPRHPIALILAGTASGTAALYGSEYFLLQG